MRVELLSFEGCPNAEAFLPRLRELMAEAGIGEPVQQRRVESVRDAERERFLGSPTVRVDGRDVDPGAGERADFGLKCRIYHTPAGMAGTPAEEWVLNALRGAAENRRAMTERPPRSLGVIPDDGRGTQAGAQTFARDVVKLSCCAA
jgi:hypothetical protein